MSRPAPDEVKTAFVVPIPTRAGSSTLRQSLEEVYNVEDALVVGGALIVLMNTAAREAAHVVQQRSGVQLKGGVGEAGDAYERHADAVADRVVAGRSAEALLDGGAAGGPTQAIQRKETKDDAQILENQARLKGTDVEIPALEGALLATRKEAVKQGLLSQASYDAGLVLSQAMTQLQPAVADKGAVDKGVQDKAAIAAQQMFAALQRETAHDDNFQIDPSSTDGTAVTSHNPYTQETRLTTYILAWIASQNTASRFQHLPELIQQGKWDEAFRGYRGLLDGLDLWVADQLRKKGKGTPEEALGNAQEHYSQLRTGLEQIAGKHAMRLPALFHPAPEAVEMGKAAGRPVADTIPLNVYFWKDKQDGTFHLYDVTSPSHPQEHTLDGPPTAAMLNTFFEEVARYPKGEVRYSLPGGGAGVALTTGDLKWYEWVGYAGMAVAAVGLALVTAGASIPATVCFAAGAAAGALSAAGHLVDSERLGTATTATVVLDVAQIAASFASMGALTITAKAGSAAAALAGNRYFVPMLGLTAVADGVQLVALSDITFAEMSKIQNGAGKPEDKQRAVAILLTQLIVASGMTALSVQGVRNASALKGESLELIDQNGVKVLRLMGEDAPVPFGPPEPHVKGAAKGIAATGSKSDPHVNETVPTSKKPPVSEKLPVSNRTSQAPPARETTPAENTDHATKPKVVTNERLTESEREHNLAPDVVEQLRAINIDPQAVDGMVARGVTPAEIMRIHGEFGQDGTLAIVALVKRGIDPRVAERSLHLAGQLGIRAEISDLVNSGNLENPAGLRNCLQKVSDEIAVGQRGAMNELLEVVKRARQGHRIFAGGRRFSATDPESGQADVVDHTARDALQMKTVTSAAEDKVLSNLNSAVDQLGGKGGEMPPLSYQRTADVRITNPDNPLFNADRATLQDALLGKIRNVDNLEPSGVAPGRVRITNGHGTFDFSATELR